MSAKYRFPVIFGQCRVTHQSRGLWDRVSYFLGCAPPLFQ